MIVNEVCNYLDRFITTNYELKAMMDNRCQVRTSFTSVILKDSVLTVSLLRKRLQKKNSMKFLTELCTDFKPMQYFMLEI